MDEDIYYESNEEEGGEDESQNRTFLYLIGAMIATLVCALAAVAGYVVFIRPGQLVEQQAANATTIAYNATLSAQIVAGEETAEAATSTPTLAPTFTPQPPPEATKTPVVQPPTHTPTVTPLVTETPEATETSASKGTATKTPTSRSSTANANKTPAPDKELADTGVGDGVSLVVLGAGLVAVLFIARRLRMSRG